MTLSIGDLVRKYKRSGDGPTEGESHVLFEVVGVGQMQERDADGKYMSFEIVKMRVRE